MTTNFGNHRILRILVNKKCEKLYRQIITRFEANFFESLEKYSIENVLNEETEKNQRSLKIFLYLPFKEKRGGANKKIIDHCQTTGKNRGAAHARSNLNVKQNHSFCVPIVLHNLTSQGSQFSITEKFDRKCLSVPFKFILQTDESFISITYGRQRVFDSTTFLKMSLDTTTKTLDLVDFVQTKKVFVKQKELCFKK